MRKIEFYKSCQDVGIILPMLYNKTVLEFWATPVEITEFGFCPFTSLSQDFMKSHGFTWVRQHKRRGRMVRGHWRVINKIAEIEAILKLEILANQAA